MGVLICRFLPTWKHLVINSACVSFVSIHIKCIYRKKQFRNDYKKRNQKPQLEKTAVSTIVLYACASRKIMRSITIRRKYIKLGPSHYQILSFDSKIANRDRREV